jgi:hypothetical protein
MYCENHAYLKVLIYQNLFVNGETLAFDYIPIQKNEIIELFDKHTSDACVSHFGGLS